jgi:hypothetical protein
MRNFRRLLWYFNAPCLVFLFSAARSAGIVNIVAPEPLQTLWPGAQLSPALPDDYQRQWSRLVKNAKVKSGPNLRTRRSQVMVWRRALTVRCGNSEIISKLTELFPRLKRQSTPPTES